MPENCFTKLPLKLFSEGYLKKIHEGVVRLLETIGVAVENERALRLLCDYGAKCDFRKKRVFLSSTLLEKALHTVTNSYELYPRRAPADKLTIDRHHSYTISGGAATRLYAEGTYRMATQKDVIDMTRLHEKLDNIHILINVVEPCDVVGLDLYPRIAADLFCHSSKPLLLQANGKKDVQKLIKMASVFAGGERKLKENPLFITGANARPPLAIPFEAAEVLIEAASAGIPVSMGCYTMAGFTSPLDVVGTILQRTATLLGGLVLTQAVNPHSGYDFSCGNGLTDLKTAGVICMSPMVMQIIAGSVQMGRFYDLVTIALSASEARAPDAQAASEKTFSLLTSLASGANLVHGATSEMAGLDLADYAQCVVDDAMAGYLFRFVEGPKGSEIDTSVDMIAEVANSASSTGLGFLEHADTLNRCREAQRGAELFEMGSSSNGSPPDRTGIYETAQGRVEQILSGREELYADDLKNEIYHIAFRD